jgi:type IV fimbrial biogenesis protein FimT
MYRGQSTRHMGGFTLVELMITVLVAAVLLAIAAPGFRSLIERNRLQAATSNLYTSLVLARSEALKRNQPVIVCQSASGQSCGTTPAGRWEDGWIVHVDPNNPPTLDPNDIIAVREGLDGGDTVWVVDDPNATTPAGKQLVTYQTDGGAAEQVFFVLCNADGDADAAKVVALSLTGRPTVRGSVADCLP